MARPLKSGIDYYPMDVDFLQDIKIRRILKGCGASSISVLICLLGNIYRDEGYYIRWSEDIGFLIADEIGIKEVSVKEIVRLAISVDFFDKNMFQNFEILTSKGIQKRYVEACSRRVGTDIIPEYSLLEDGVNVNNNSVSAYNNSINADNNRVNACKSTQRKGKESKVKESKGEERKGKYARARDPSLPPSLKKSAFGKFHNVFLTEQEYRDLLDTYEDPKQLIRRVSMYLANAKRTYGSHYALALRIAEDDNYPRKRKEYQDPYQDDTGKEYMTREEYERHKKQGEISEAISDLAEKLKV